MSRELHRLIEVFPALWRLRSIEPRPVTARDSVALGSGMTRSLCRAIAGLGLAIVFLIGATPDAIAQCTLQNAGNGTWSSGGNWSCISGTTPTSTIEAIFQTTFAKTITLNAAGAALDLSGGTTGVNATTIALGSNVLTLGAGTGSYGGLISGTGGLTLNSGSNQTFTGTLSHTATTTINSGGQLLLLGPRLVADEARGETPARAEESSDAVGVIHTGKATGRPGSRTARRPKRHRPTRLEHCL